VVGTGIGIAAAETLRRARRGSSERTHRTSGGAVEPEDPTGVAEFSEPHEIPEWNSFRRLPVEVLDRIREFERVLHEIRRHINDVLDEYRVRDSGELPLVAQDALRTTLMESGIVEHVSGYADVLVGFHDQSRYEWALQIFERCSSHGLLYKAMQDSSVRRQVPVPIAHDGSYYAARVKDYLPVGTNVWSQDIDPRNKPDIDSEQRQELEASPGWSGINRKRAFRLLANNQFIQRLSKQADLTVAEYFSLLKAVYHEHGREHRLSHGAPATKTVEERAAQMLVAREAFLNTMLVDHTTECAIVFYGRDRQRLHQGDEERGWQEVFDAVGVDQRCVQVFGTSPEHNVEDVRNRLYQAITRSRGNTFIAFDAHGAKNRLGIDDVSNETILYQGLATALVDRLRQTRDAASLSEMTLCIEACYSYDFAQKLVEEIKKQWEAYPSKPFPVSALRGFPKIVTTVQEGAQATHRNKIVSLLTDYTRGVQEDRGLSGRRVLQVIQPIAYATQDMTVFASENNMEFAALRRAASDWMRA
ncbi:hypothetical protein KBB27_02490, partial [Patescibacteria group bacterium]|nr:hypothetical protein [Patescibacteria group bacterium]